MQEGNMKEEFDCGNTHEKSAWLNSVSRRDFIRSAAIGAAGIALTGSHTGCSTSAHSPREGLGNLFTEGDKPLLVVVEGADMKKMLEAGLDALGGLKQLAASRKVVLKPNMLTSEPPPVTTDIEVTVGVAEAARQAGASSIVVCDGSSCGVSKAGKFEAMGYPARLQAIGVGLDAVDFGDRQSYVFVRKPAWHSHTLIGVAKTLQEADVIVSLPMIKRHSGARFTCALKNHFGSVYGPLRFVAHEKLQSGGDGQRFFDEALAEFADAVRPELNIVDGRSLLIRGGPSLSGKATVKSGVNRIIFCGDIVATDVYCSKLMQEYDDSYSSDMISIQLEAAEKLGLGVRDLKNVVVKEITV
jgi:uncharacterized protein (DUF362 family)